MGRFMFRMSGFQSIKALAITGFAAGMAALGAQSAQAETLDVRGLYAANVDMPGFVETIVVDTIFGEAGADAEIAIQQKLGAASVDGDLYYRVLRADAPMNGASVRVGNQQSVRSALAPDAILSGTVRADVIERRIEPRITKKCVERDEDDKCIKREEFPIPCWEMTVQLMPRLVLISDDGEQLYSNNAPLLRTARFCRDDSAIPSSLEIGDALIDELAQDIRLDLAPVERFQNIRVMETRKGLSKADRTAFKQAVKLTKEDQAAACRAFGELEAGNPAQVSVLFNIGLCHEARGDLERASDYYARALEISPNRSNPSAGMRRIASRQRADYQLAAREAAFASEVPQDEGAQKPAQ